MPGTGAPPSGGVFVSVTSPRDAFQEYHAQRSWVRRCLCVPIQRGWGSGAMALPRGKGNPRVPWSFTVPPGFWDEPHRQVLSTAPATEVASR